MDRTTTVLQILASARRLGAPDVGRTTLVKLVYLCELLRPAYDLWTRSYEFVRYRYGPYSKDVLARTDFLVFHRFVDVAAYERQGHAVQASYRVTSTGMGLAATLANTAQGKRLQSLSEDVVWGLQTLGIRTARDICNLVYAEPYFAQLLAEASAADGATTGAELMSPQDPRHPSFRLQAFLTGHPAVQKAQSPRLMVRAYLGYLAMQHVQKDVARG